LSTNRAIKASYEVDVKPLEEIALEGNYSYELNYIKVGTPIIRAFNINGKIKPEYSSIHITGHYKKTVKDGQVIVESDDIVDNGSSQVLRYVPQTREMIVYSAHTDRERKCFLMSERDVTFTVRNVHDSWTNYKFVAKNGYISNKQIDYFKFHYGGVYFDTDVEVIGHMDDIISRGPFMGLEVSGERFSVNPGLGLATDVGNPVYKSILESYSALPYSLYDGSRNPYTMIPLVSDLFRGKGLTGKMEIQTVDGISVYAPDFFNPLDDATGRLLKTSNTRSIHWYMKSWMPEETPLKVWSKRLMRRLFGKTTVSRLRSLFNK
jgi:hypothetical protein